MISSFHNLLSCVSCHGFKKDSKPKQKLAKVDEQIELIKPKPNNKDDFKSTLDRRMSEIDFLDYENELKTIFQEKHKG